MKWNRRTFTSSGLTQFPAGPYLPKPKERKVYVTSSGFDDIGQILTSMNVVFEPFCGKFDCAVLFINCGTGSHIDSVGLADFVHKGGCLYASDHADRFVAEAFPGLIDFGGHIGASGQVETEVLDAELRDVVGPRLTVEFDMSDWATIKSCKGEVLLKGRTGSYANQPIMVYAEYGLGAVFYSSFHNKAQTSVQERGLLQLLVLKQFGVSAQSSIERAGKSLGIDLASLKRNFQM